MERITIDADWDKPAWARFPAAVIGNHMGEKPEHLPLSQFKIAYDAEALYVIFRVQDRYVRAVTTQHQLGEVWKDSCVEFFFTPGNDPAIGHFYLEMNCGGTMLFRFHGPTGVVTIPESDYSQLNIAHSMPEIVDPEIAQTVTWTLEYRLPVHVLKKYCPVTVPATGVIWRANFYKCADGSSHPHWLTWSPVLLPKPDFHRPEFFGVLEFD